jgi:tryptophanyl-tRNA synthetase
MNKVILSGIRPTGKLHLGNYLGAIKDFVRLQDEGNCFYFVADWHSLTTFKDYSKLREYSMGVVLDFLSAGLEPEKCTIFLQSDIPEIAELALLLSNFQSANELYVLPTYKEKVEKDPKNNNAGLLYYPILMAADILAHKANLVPVGSDQEIHVRVARNIARRFNNEFGKIFPMPQIFEKESIRVPGLDNSGKMGKSEENENVISLSDPPKTVRSKLAVAVTDTARKRRNDPGHPFECNIFAIHEFFSNEESIRSLQKNCMNAEIGCVECKKMLGDKIIELLEPMQEKRKEISERPNFVEKVLQEGKIKARASAQKTLAQVRENLGLVSVQKGELIWDSLSIK